MSKKKKIEKLKEQNKRFQHEIEVLITRPQTVEAVYIEKAWRLKKAMEVEAMYGDLVPKT